ncbi:COG2426 family protein [Chloroflexota bacterium]
MPPILLIALITLVPWIELRLSIPIGIIDKNLDPIIVFVTAVVVNILLFFPIYFGLKFAYKYLARWKFFERTTTRIREKGEPYVKKYGVIGLGVFIGIPLPGSGVYSGTLLAWLVGMGWKKAFVASIIGVFIAGSIILGLAMAGLTDALGAARWPITGTIIAVIALFILWRWRTSRKRKRALGEQSAEPGENA